MHLFLKTMITNTLILPYSVICLQGIDRNFEHQGCFRDIKNVKMRDSKPVSRNIKNMKSPDLNI